MPGGGRTPVPHDFFYCQTGPSSGGRSGASSRRTRVRQRVAVYRGIALADALRDWTVALHRVSELQRLWSGFRWIWRSGRPKVWRSRRCAREAEGATPRTRTRRLGAQRKMRAVGGCRRRAQRRGRRGGEAARVKDAALVFFGLFKRLPAAASHARARPAEVARSKRPTPAAASGDVRGPERRRGDALVVARVWRHEEVARRRPTNSSSFPNSTKASKLLPSTMGSS